MPGYEGRILDAEAASSMTKGWVVLPVPPAKLGPLECLGGMRSSRRLAERAFILSISLVVVVVDAAHIKL